jgi:hypothetical protein
LATLQKIPALRELDPGLDIQVMGKRVPQILAQGQTKNAVRRSGSHKPGQHLGLVLFRKNNPDRVGTGSGNIPQKILLIQSGKVEIAQNNIRHYSGKKLLELLDGCAITDKMRPGGQQFLKSDLA